MDPLALAPHPSPISSFPAYCAKMTNNIQIIPFCAPLPQSNGSGVVGTITLRGQSAIIWFGWGDIEPCENDETLVKERYAGEVASVGNG